MATTLTISKQVFLSNLNGGLTYPIDSSAAFPYTITAINGIQTSSGTVTASLQIGGTNITGLNNISVSSTAHSYNASGANAVALNSAVTLVFSNNSSAQNIQFTLVATRNAVSSVSNSDGTLNISPTEGDVVASLASLPSSEMLVGNTSNIATAVTMSGDATLSNTGVVTVSKTGGTAFGSLATLNAAPAGTLSGSTLAASVTASSLTSLGTITTGVWNAGALTSSGAIKGTTFEATTTPTTAAQFDASGSATINVANGSNAVITPSGESYFLVAIAEVLNTGQGALYLCSNGNCGFLGTAAGSIWVASTTTPGAGHSSVAYNGSAYVVYNNQGSAGDFAVTLIRLH